MVDTPRRTLASVSRLSSYIVLLYRIVRLAGRTRTGHTVAAPLSLPPSGRWYGREEFLDYPPLLWLQILINMARDGNDGLRSLF